MSIQIGNRIKVKAGSRHYVDGWNCNHTYPACKRCIFGGAVKAATFKVIGIDEECEWFIVSPGGACNVVRGLESIARLYFCEVEAEFQQVYDWKKL